MLGATRDPTMNTKSIVQSKTFWIQLIAFASAFFPPARAWMVANPETAVGALGALNIVVRFITSGKITIFAAGANDDSAGSGMAPCWLMGTAIAGLSCIALQSCSPTQVTAFSRIPIRAGITTDTGSYQYSSKSGITAEVDATSRK